jgi:hypothetical protein
MGTKKDQHKAGTPAKPRGQQTGFAGNPDQNREEMEKTPALRGRRKNTNKMFGDASEQHVASNPSTPSTNAPSTVANVGPKSPAGGERVFKRGMRQK